MRAIPSQPQTPPSPALSSSRRGFLKGAAATAGAALLIGFDGAGQLAAKTPDAAGESVSFNPFVTIGADNKVTVVIKHFEMGQGTTTGLSTIVAEELDADWGQIGYAFAPADESRYANLAFGAQGTGGSTAIANSWTQYRQAGAGARAVMVAAAAKLWGAKPAAITVSEGVVSGPDGKTATFGALVAHAAGIAAPKEPALKTPDQFKLIGREDLRRLDQTAKTDGSAEFAIDLDLPDMVYAVMARSPRFGGTLKSFDAAEARKVRGVLDVKETPVGVAVFATSTWAAIKGRNALTVEWDFAAAENRSTDAIKAEHQALLEKPGLSARNDGDADAALAKDGVKTISADFTFPFLAHAPLEPLNCVVQIKGDKVTVWDGCQFPTLVKGALAQVLGVPATNVEIHTVYAGGSFGRRATPNADYQTEAALAAKALGDGRPVKLVWTREDDVKGGRYRPFVTHRIEAAVDAAGKPTAWRQRVAGKSILIGSIFESFLVKDGIDATSVEGASNLPYAIPNLRVDVHNTQTETPVLWWRAVGHTHTAYATEVAIDMLAEAAGADPVAFRMGLLEKHPRHAAVLKLAAEKAGWGSKLPEGWGRGVSLHESFSSYVAQIAEVSVSADGAVKVERFVCAVDCGLVINPDVVRAQMEGGIGFGLGAVMRNKITLTEGAVDQENYWDYEPIRMADMPKVEVHMVASGEAPTGVGEPGVPPAGPAVANAIFAATGKRLLDLPLTDAGVEFA